MTSLKITIIFIFSLLFTSFVIFPISTKSFDQSISKVEIVEITETAKLLMSFYRIESIESSFKVRNEINNSIDSTNSISTMTFYSEYTNSWSINRAIIDYSYENEVPVHIAFAIAWQESKFNPAAISAPNNNGSRDWGLFQLNDGYRNWSREQFLNINLNVEEGIKHFKWCYDELGDIILALQAYNAGMSRVKNNTVPDSTINYVDSILQYESILDEAWNKEFNVS